MSNLGSGTRGVAVGPVSTTLGVLLVLACVGGCEKAGRPGGDRGDSTRSEARNDPSSEETKSGEDEETKDDVGEAARRLSVGLQALPGSEVLDDVVDIAAGSDAGCALRSDGGVYCWGRLEESTDPEQAVLPFVEIPTYVAHRIPIEPSQSVTDIEINGQSLLALTSSGRIYQASGSLSSFLDLRDPREETKDTPTPAPVPHGFVTNDEIAAKYPEDTAHLRGTGPMAELASRRLVWSGVDDVAEMIGPCWVTQSRRFTCGGGQPAHQNRQYHVVPTGWHLFMIFEHLCGLRPGSEVRCKSMWEPFRREPVFDFSQPPFALPGKPMRVWHNSSTICAKLIDDSLVCWDGTLGTEPYEKQPTFTHKRIEVDDVAIRDSWTGGYQHVYCAVVPTGAVTCWGPKPYENAKVLNPQIVEAFQPRQVPGIDDAVQIEAGRAHNCVRTNKGTVKCFGANDLGQCGAGLPSDPLTEPSIVLKAPDEAH